MRRRAGLHHHEPHRLVLKPALELATREPRSLDHFPVLVGDNQLKNVLGKINSNGSSIHLGLLLSIVLKPPKASAGTMMPNKEREESIPSLLPDAFSLLRCVCGAAQRER